MSAVGSGAGLLDVRSLSEEIAHVLQRDIICGVYKPGQRLIERQIGARFQVSSIPVREALQQLERRGLVTRRLNYGCSVVQLTPLEVGRICELRQVLEPQVMEWAAARMTPSDGERLRAQLERLRGAAEAQNLAEFFYEDLKFHKIIWDCADNRFASEALEQMVGSLFAAGLRDPTGLNLVAEYKKHVRLTEALEAGTQSGAPRLLRSIARGFEKHLREAAA